MTPIAYVEKYIWLTRLTFGIAKCIFSHMHILLYEPLTACVVKCHAIMHTNEGGEPGNGARLSSLQGVLNSVCSDYRGSSLVQPATCNTSKR